MPYAIAEVSIAARGSQKRTPILGHTREHCEGYKKVEGVYNLLNILKSGG